MSVCLTDDRNHLRVPSSLNLLPETDMMASRQADRVR